MAKPRLEKVRALFYVLQHIQEGASNFDTPSFFTPPLSTLTPYLLTFFAIIACYSKNLP